MSDLTLAEAIQMAYRAQDLQRELLVQHNHLMGGSNPVGPSGRRGFDNFEQILDYLEMVERDISRLRLEIERFQSGEGYADTRTHISTVYAKITGQRRFFMPITTVEELNSLDHDDTVNGYHAGTRNEPEPFDKGKAYWHGWRNGMMDKKHMPYDEETYRLARLLAQSKGLR